MLTVKTNWFSLFKERKNMKDGTLTTFEDCEVTREGEQMRAGDRKMEKQSIGQAGKVWFLPAESSPTTC